MAITREDIINAAEALERDGEKVTMASVREFLNGGSFATISPVLREWKESRKTTIAVALEMPGELKTVAERMETEFWQTASRLANEKLVTVQAESETAVSAAEGERDEALQEVSRLETDLETRSSQQQAMVQEKQSIQEQYSQLQADLIRFQEQLSASQTEAGRLRDDLQRMTSEKDRQADEASRLLGLNGELKRELEESRKLHREADQLCQAEVIKTTNLENNLNHLIGEKEVLTETSQQQAAELMKLKTTVSGLEARVDDRNIKLRQMETESGKLKEENRKAAKVSAELDSAKTRLRELAQETGELKQENKVLVRESGSLQGQVRQLEGVVKDLRGRGKLT